MNRRNWFAKLAATAAAISLTPKVKAEPKTYAELEEQVLGYHPLSLQERIAALQAAVAQGMLTVNEARATLGLGPLEGQ